MALKRYQTILVIIFAGLTIFGAIGLNVGPSNITRGTHQAITSDGVSISYNLYYPRDLAPGRPMIVMGHGVIVNKEMMTNYAIELASHGFVVANIDWRGHGMSTGELDNSGLDLDLQAVINGVPSLVPSVDVNRIGLIGYSMGGGPTYRYAASHAEVKAWVGVGTNGDGSISNITNPRNVLLIVGEFDEAFPLVNLKQTLVNLTGPEIASPDDVEFNTLYGSIENGTARKIQVVPFNDHLTVPWDQTFVRGVVDWMVVTFDGTSPDLTFMAYHWRAFLLFLSLTGLVGLVYGVTLILKQLLHLEPSEGAEARESFEDLKVGTFTWKYYLTTIALIPSALLPGITLFTTPLFMSAFLATLVGGMAIGILVFTWRRLHEIKIPLRSMFSFNRSRQAPAWVLSMAITATFMIGYYFIIGLNYLGTIPHVTRLPYLVLFGAIIFISVLFISLFTKKVLMPFIEGKFRKKETKSGKKVNRNIIYIVQSSILAGLLISWNAIVIGLFCILMRSAFLMMVFYLQIPIFLFTSFTGVFFERTLGSSIPPALLHATVLGMLITTLSPWGNLLAMFVH